MEHDTPGTWAGMPLAGWRQRVGALLIDSLIIALPVIAVVLLVSPAVGYLLGAVATLTYYPLLMARGGERNGQTLGKQWMAIRAVRESAEPFDYGAAVLREFVVKYLLFGVAASFFLGIPTLLNYLWPLWDDGSQALHDKLASTRVVTTEPA